MKPQTTLRAALADPNLLDLGAPLGGLAPVAAGRMGEKLTADELLLHALHRPL